MTPMQHTGLALADAAATPLPGRRSRTYAGSVAGTLLLVLVTLYIFTAVRISATRPLWMDEVLATWISRFSSPAEIWYALGHGAEFAPPAYHLLLHYLTVAFGGSSLVLRLPSVVAALVCGAAVFSLVRRRIAFPFAALAVALTLELAIFNFAVQAREYVLVTACFACALLGWDRAGVWDGARERGVAIWRCAVIAGALSLAMALHFYAGLLVGVMIGMEAVRSLAARRLRPRIWLALAVPILTLGLWLPLMRSVLRYNAGDTSAAHYIARPTLAALLRAYGDLLLGPNSLLLMAFASIMALALLLRHFVPQPLLRAASAITPPNRDADLDFDILTAATVAIPLAVFAAGVLVTHTFNERYALAAALGIAILYARLVARLPGGTWIACGLLAASCGLWGIHALRALTPPGDPDLALLHQATGDQPIVVGEGLRYLQLEEAADPQLKQRLVFLSLPGVVSPDPTNANQVERWAPLRPDLAIRDLASFVATHHSFYLVASSDPKDVVTGHFIQSGEITRVDGRTQSASGDSWLCSVQVR